MENRQLEKKTKTREELFNHPWIAAKYYDYPDGQDLPGKLLFVTKITATIGACLGSVHAVNVRENISFEMKCLRFSRVFIPCVGLGAVFTCVTYYSTILREKDDEINYFFGGVATGSLCGLINGRFSTSAWMASLFGLLGIMRKGLHMQNKPMFAESPRRTIAPYYSETWDFTLLPEIKGKWTK